MGTKGESSLLAPTRGKPSCATTTSDDIVWYLVSLLSVKSLSILSTSCRSYHNLVSDGSFHKWYNLQSKQNPRLLVAAFHPKTHPFYSFDTKTSELCKLRLPITSYSGFFSCSELVCMYKFWTEEFTATDESHQAIHVCNPSNGNVISLTDDDDDEEEEDDDDESCDCERILDAVGFGYVDSTKEYKVLRRVFHNGYCSIQWGWEVFTLSAAGDDNVVRAVGGGWRAVSNPPFELDDAMSGFVNSFVYFLPRDRLNSATSGIVRFDLEREQWSVLPFPAAHCISPKNAKMLKLREMGGKLCLEDYGESPGEVVDIWTPVDVNKGEWVKEYGINLSSLSSEYRTSLVRAKSIMKDGRVLMEIVGESTVMLYEPKSRRFQHFPLLCTGEEKDEYFVAAVYAESFLSLES